MKTFLSVLLILSVLFGQSLWAQGTTDTDEVIRPVTASMSVAIGPTQVRNTYLTPLLYEGTSYSVEYQRWRLQPNLSWANWHQLQLSYADAFDRGEHGNMYAARLRYQYGSLRRIIPAQSPAWSFFVGPMASADLGFDYNLKMSGGNNPATARVATNMGAVMAASYSFAPRGLHLPVMLQVSAPLIGAAMMPEYGASYYETFYLDHGGNYIHFTSLHNQQDIDARLSTDIPLALLPFMRHCGAIIRLGTSYHIETMDINHINTRLSSFQFVVGWVYRYIPYDYRKSYLLKRQPYEAY